MSFHKMTPEEWKDAFITDSLSENDRAIFQSLIDANPELQEQIQFEESIKNASVDARKKELKARLSAINVEAPTMFSIPRTALVGSIMVASVMTSILVYFDTYKEHHIFAPSQNTQQTRKNVGNNAKNIQHLRSQNNPKQENIHNNTNDNTPTKTQEINNPAPQISYTNAQNVAGRLAINTPKSTTEQQETKAQENQTKTEKSIFIAQPLDINVKVINRSTTQKAITLSSIKPRTEGKAETKQQAETNNIAYQTPKKDNDLGIFDGKQEKTLEHDTQGQKLLYQCYNGKLFVFSKHIKGTELHLDEKSGKRHFLYYDKQFFEFFENQVEKTELRPVNQPELIDRLKKELLNR